LNPVANQKCSIRSAVPIPMSWHNRRASFRKPPRERNAAKKKTSEVLETSERRSSLSSDAPEEDAMDVLIPLPMIGLRIRIMMLPWDWQIPRSRQTICKIVLHGPDVPIRAGQEMELQTSHFSLQTSDLLPPQTLKPE